MSTVIVFVHCGANDGITEIELSTKACIADVRKALLAVGRQLDKDLCLYIDEAEHSYGDDEVAQLDGIKQGAHLHFCRCRKITTTVNYLDESKKRTFPPGTRVRRVKAWAVREFKIQAGDAGEHVLRLCNSTVEPPTDTPLHELTESPECCVCFDLVPEKRVEG